LLQKVRIKAPDQIETDAAAVVLHSFYNGVENIFSRIASRIDENIPSSESSHRDLLKQMSIETDARAAVISNELFEALEPYLGFRHIFRHAYGYRFVWDKMKGAVLNLDDVFDQFQKEINIFIAHLESK